ncbi:MAG TPA: hypothetical protein VJU82_15875 [Acidobacteriaceae bacterium]|nr:hypothetical protein [Acidobacteriaceae bacterium]
MRSVTSKCLVLAVALSAMAPAFAKDDAPLMPPYILRARTVAVVIDTAAGVSVRDPNANQTARKDVETALLNWGRFEPVMSVQGADLVILIRKGSKGPADVAIADSRQNRRGGVVEPLDDGIAVGVQRGPSGPQGSGRSTVPAPQGPAETRPVAQTGTPGDVFQVFDGKTDDPLNGVPGWQYVKKDGLHSHDVPAVAAFRKAIDEAEKAQQKQAHP